MKEYPPHPYADLFPMRAGQSLIDLSDSIAEHGQLEPIVLLDKQVLDGRRRQAAAIRAGKVPITRDFGSRPTDGEDALEFSYATNFYRRDDLTEAERTFVAVGYSTFKKGDNQYTKGQHPANAGSSQKEAAKKFGVSEASLERAKAVMEHGTPELIEAMKSELVSVSDAAAVASETPELQKAAIASVKAEAAGTLKEAVARLKPDPGEDLAKVVRELRGIIDRLGRVVTEQPAARDLACQGLQAALALVLKL